ncbi:Bug family tripartite tricarboxylate transporter substrate binding protein [Stutzerimonas tarimensis]|uniref:Bug family tripartite tricarboxylate transporter substrate binding protein n=1 Tax=Stutzerimonas tarimensis TaxID=1507735 RepID=A0ABV7TAB6_9GAMM
MAKKSSLRRWLLSLGACLTFATCGVSQAAEDEAYPNRTVKIVVPYPAGGGTDTLARLLAEHFSDVWGRPVVVENKPGGSGMIGTSTVARAQPDGHTLLLTINALVQGALFESQPYDPATAFVPIAEIARAQSFMVVPEGSPVSSFEEFVAMASKKPDQYTYGSYGNGTSAHMYGEMLNQQKDLKLRHIPYQGVAPLLTDALAGRLDAAFVDVGSARSHIDAGKFKVIAVSGGARSPLAPDVPTFTELGLENYGAWGWFGLLAPAGTPDPIVEKISAQASKALKAQRVVDTLAGFGLQPGTGNHETFAESYQRDLKTWTRIIRETGITVR